MIRKLALAFALVALISTAMVAAYGLTTTLQEAERSLEREYLFLLVLAVAMGVAYFFAGWLTHLLRALQQGVRQSAAGDLSQRVQVQDGDELGDLARDFNRMADGLERRAREQEALLQLSRKLLVAHDWRQILDLAAGSAADLLRVDHVAVLLPDPSGELLVLQAQRGLGGELVGRFSLKMHELTITGYAMARAAPVFIEDMRLEKRFHVPPLAHELALRTGLAVRMMVGEESLGVVVVASRQLRRFSTADAELLSLVANLAAVAYRGAVAGEEAMRLAANLERQEALLESESRFRRLTETPTSFVFRCELQPTRGYSYISPTVTHILGYTPEEHYSDPHLSFKLVPPKDLPALQELAAVPAEERTVIFRSIRKDGRIIWLERRNVAVRDGLGELVAYEGMVRDVTERVQMEQELQSSEERFRTSVENMLDPFGIYSALRDESGRIVDFRVEYVNAAACASNAMTREAQVGGRPLELLPAHREIGLFDDYCRVVETGEPLVKEALVYEDRYGGRRLSRAFEISAGKLGDGFTASWRDVTERKRAEEALRESEERFRRVFEEGPIGMKIVAQDHRILQANAAMARMLGYTEQELAHLKLEDVTHPEDLDNDVELARRLFEGELPGYQMEKRCLARDGRLLWTNVTVSVVRDETGRPQYGLRMVEDVTERKRAEESRRDSEERWRSLVENAPDMILTVDRAGKILFANRVPAGLTVEQALGTSVYDYVGTEYREAARRSIEGVFRTGRPDAYEIAARGPHGTTAWYSSRVGPISQGDEVAAAILITRDITDRKRAEEALRESEGRYRALFEAAGDAIFVHDVAQDGMPQKFVSVNDIACTRLGYSREELLQMAPDDIDAPSSSADMPEVAATLLREGQANMARVHVARDGRHIPVEIIARLFDLGGRPMVLSIARDVTERRRTERRLARVNETLLGFGADPDENVQRLTALAGELLGGTCALYNRLDRGMLCSLGQWNVPPDYNPVDRPEGHLCYDVIKCGCDKVLVVRDLQHSRYAETSPNVGRYRLQTYMGHAVKCRGECVGSVCVLYQVDYTPSEEDKRLLGIIASAIGVEEERKLAQGELAEARDAAQAANRAKSEFLANMSHELRTPLNAIIGFSQLLAEQSFGPLNEEQGSFVRYIVEGGDHLLDLINDILDLAKVEAGRMDLDLSEFVVAAMLKEMQSLVKALAARRSIGLSVEVQESVGAVTVDQVKFKQIMYNLLSNAIKFTPEGGSVKVVASPDREVGPEGMERRLLRISVTDTGIGIRREDQERVFGVFERVDSSYGRQQEGTGLGLALTRKLVELHGGRIWVESEGPGRGSTFNFVIPVERM